VKRLAAVLAALALAACAAGSSDGLPKDVKAADVSAHQRITLVDAPPLVPATKILVIVEENHSYAQMKAQMPYLWSLSQKYGYATNSFGNAHPSQPNYVFMLTGENRGVTSNTLKSVHGHSIMDLARANGKTAKTTADGMGKTNRCYRKANGKYVPRHNAEGSFIDHINDCRRYNYDYAYWAGDAAAGKLGNIHFLIPSNAHNGHDASLKAADDWLKKALAPVFAGPDWKSGRLAIVVTADEDDKKSGQKILTTVIHPSQTGNVVTTRLDHVSLHKTLARFAGVAPLGPKAAAANDLADAFNLPVQ
jgi:hypothetical protein